ncbi:putative damage-inducible protein DinB [Pedobacter nutrimenti]|uniref:Putative damage-inducible protein DinB n=2 Tax=Pedobacter nutrimenti TaxID=1241337 RepID=A0A318U7X8_9SPHI|nr:putative damage-inducible protein DinB [Pedobacter nutrimenti]
MIKMYLEELEQEAKVSKKMLERIPNDHFGWKPHEKSMDIKNLAGHLADLHSWAGLILSTDELDFMNMPYQLEDMNNTAELLNCLEKSLDKSRAQLVPEMEKALNDNWTLRSGETIYDVSPKTKVIRMSLNQITHHRAQLGVYLRLLDIPLPASYGPSADEKEF